ncbi:MAG: biotin--[acetyl-CoA-carboxylase] ligase [Candidatus Omnitrophota bacterium]|nr:biotin--[acetyl-CoA-carboxylase] ligase [Candidatus Omnitrophota bacterium]
MSAKNLVADAPRDSALERRLAAALAGTRLGRPLYGFQRVGSTMDVAKALAEQGAPEGTLVWAARQDHGRGRLGRVWESPEGGAYFSLILRPSPGTPPTGGVGEGVPQPKAEGRPTRSLQDIPQLSLVAGLSAAEAIRELTTLSPSIRWPNDLLLNGRKVAGILIEASVQRIADSVQNYIVVGVGINVSTDPRELPEGSTSLREALGSSYTLYAKRYPLDPVALTVALCRKFDGWYDSWTAKGFAPIREALRPWLTLGALVRLTTNSSQVEGQASDVDEQGRLLVRLESGVMRSFEAGEVALLR